MPERTRSVTRIAAPLSPQFLLFHLIVANYAEAERVFQAIRRTRLQVSETEWSDRTIVFAAAR
jgi:hypothetical protein